MSRLWRAGREVWGHLSVRAGIYALAAITAPAWAKFLGHLVPPWLLSWSSGPALEKMLGIITSNMLTIVTFSLSTLVATLALILSSAPPRATALIVRDERAHRALATFLGAFLFSVSAVVFYSAGAFGPEDQLILSVMTIGVLLAVVWTIVRWIGHLSGMGQLSNLIERVERIAEQANQNQASLFADDQSEPAPAWTEGGYQILAADCGFIQRVDYDHLTRVATAHHFRLTALVTAGTYVLPGAPLLVLDRADADQELISSLRSGFTLGDRRTFADDPRFGFIVLSEIGSRALSPGINDPGTAIQVLASLFKLVNALPVSRTNGWAEETRLRLRRITTREIFDDAFRAIARDGAAMIEVQIFLQKGLAQLYGQSRFARSAAALSAEALVHARSKIECGADWDRVSRAAVMATS